MSRERPRNIAASVADRLLQRARQTGEEHQLLLTRFGLERLMYRLSESPARDRFVVKGALLFLVWAEEPFPVLLDFPPPILRLYPRETVVAEKFEAMEQLGLLNSRMKDYYDLWTVARQYAFDGELLCQAVRNTFRRRKTEFPAGEPEGLSEAYATDRAKNAQWAAFARRARLRAGPRELKEAIELLRRFLLPVLQAARQNTAFSSHWPPGGPWHSR